MGTLCERRWPAALRVPLVVLGGAAEMAGVVWWMGRPMSSDNQ